MSIDKVRRGGKKVLEQGLTKVQDSCTVHIRMVL